MKFEDTYFVSNEHFSGPGFDWNFHQNPEFLKLQKTNSNFQNPVFHNQNLATVIKILFSLSYLKYIKDDVLSFTNFQRAFEVPGTELLNNEHYKHVIPKVLGNWKSTIIRFLFSRPSQKIVT
jgi:hypothetical protein